MMTPRTKTLAIAALIAATGATGGYYVLSPSPAAPPPIAALVGRSVVVVDITDAEKLDAEGKVRDILARGAAAGKLQQRPSDAHLGIFYGQRRQSGMSHADAVAAIVDVATVWAGGGRETPVDGLVVFTDDEILEVVGQVSRIGADDWGSVFDLGTQYGVRRQAGQSIAMARHETGQWLVRWFGGENPWPSGVPPSTNTRNGRLRLDGKGYYDDGGRVLPVYAHAGNLLAVFARDEAKALDQLDRVAAAGFHGVRYWNQLGCGPRTNVAPFCNEPFDWNTHRGDYWFGNEVGPGYTQDYWGVERRFAQALLQRNLRAVLSQGDPAQLQDRVGYMARLAALDNELGGFIDFIDGSNEGLWVWEDNPAKIAAHVQAYAAAGGAAIRSTTSGRSEATEDVNYVAIPPSQVFDIHSDRGGRFYDWIRHIFSSGYDGHYRYPFGISSEPPGGGGLVSNCTNCNGDVDDESAALMAVTAMIARQAFVWFSGEGVMIRAGLQTEPGFSSVPRAVALLPRTMMAWPQIYHAGRAEGILGPVPADRGAVVRTECREGDGQAVCVTHGPGGDYTLPVKRGFIGKVCHPADATCEPVDVRAGQTLRLAFRRGRILLVEQFR